MEGLGQGAAEGGGATPPREEVSEQQPVTPRMSLKDQEPLDVNDEEAAWPSPLPDQERGHLPRRLSISTTPLTMVGSPLASSDDLRRLASSSLISEVGVEQHFAFLAEAVGREGCRPTSRTTVMLRDVNYKICVGVKTTAFPTVYESVADPIKGLLQGRRRKRAVTALNRVSAVLEPNKLYLVLGGPKSGKTSLLKTIAGRIRKSRRCVDFTGEVTYNGSTADQGAFDVTSLACFVEAADTNEAFLTVRETLLFAGACTLPVPSREAVESPYFQALVENLNLDAGRKRRLLSYQNVSDPKVRLALAEQRVEMVLTLLGLTGCQDTIVGNATSRGVSGGERRRVTLGEVLMGDYSVACFDEISNGLDSSSALDIIRTIRAWAKNFSYTCAISLLQPAPEVYALFDEVLVMRSGAVVYQGPPLAARAHFEALGVACPPDADIADFVVQVTAPVPPSLLEGAQSPAGQGQQTHAAHQLSLGKRRRSPLFARLGYHRGMGMEGGLGGLGKGFTTQALLQHYRASSHGRRQRAQLDTCASRPPSLRASDWKENEQRRFRVTWWSSLIICLKREATLTLRDKSYLRARLVQDLFLGLLTGLIYWNIGQRPGVAPTTIFGALYQAILTIAFQTAACIPAYFAQRRVFYKQRAAGFFSCSSYLTAATLAGAPLVVLDSALFGGLAYWCMGLAPGGVPFWAFIANLIAIGFAMMCFFKLTCYLCPILTTAVAAAGILTFFFLLFSGFILARASMPRYYAWIMWVDPIYYAYQALACNEFRRPGPKNLYATAVPNTAGLTVGEAILQQRGLATDRWWVWLGPAVNLALGAAYFAMTLAAMSALEWTDPVNIVEDEVEADGEEEAAVAAELRGLDKTGGKEVASAAATPSRGEEKKAAGSFAGLQQLLAPLWLMMYPAEASSSSATASSAGEAGTAGAEWVRTPATEGDEHEHDDDEEEHDDGEETKEERGKRRAATAAAGMGTNASASPLSSVDSVAGGDKDLELGFPSGAVAAAAIEAALPVPTPTSLSYRRSSPQDAAAAGAITIAEPIAGPASSYVSNCSGGGGVASGGLARSRSNSGGTSALAVEPLTLTFEDVCYSVTRPRVGGRGVCGSAGGRETETVDLLQGITGYVAPGTMMALMGASGAGKTTLLDVLAGRKTGHGTVGGSILVNGRTLAPEVFKSISAYVDQNSDLHSPYMTAGEVLHFSAELRLSRRVQPETRQAFVRDVLELLELESIRDCVVGPPGAGLSFEELKRLSIGAEVVANPSLLFLDEPTTGLDARAALLVVGLLQRLAGTGRSVICSIHQPSMEVFSRFDSLLLLKQGGQTVYCGQLGDGSCELTKYLESIPGTPRLAPGENPASWMLECIGAGTLAAVTVSEVDYAQAYQDSDLSTQIYATVRRLVRQQRLLHPIGDSSTAMLLRAPQRPRFTTQLAVCVRRAWRSYWRLPDYQWARLGGAGAMAVILGTVYGSQQQETVADIVGFIALIYISQTFTACINSTAVLEVIHLERPSFFRERFANMYPLWAYSLSWLMVELPYVLLESLLFGSILYWSCNFNSDLWRFAWFLGFFFLYMAFATAFGQAIAAASPSTQYAQTAYNTIAPVFSIMSGMTFTPSDVPPVWKPLWVLTPFNKAFEGLVTTQWYGDDRGHVSVFNPHTRQFETDTRWEVVQWFFGGEFTFESRWRNFGVLLVFIGLCQLGFYLALKYRRFEKR